MTILARALGVFQRMAEEQPVTLPEAKPDVGPTGEIDPDSGAYSPTKHVMDLPKRKRKAPKKVPEFGPNSFELDNNTAYRKKSKLAKEIPVEKRKKAKKNLTLQLPKVEGTVRFAEIVLMKVGKHQKLLLLKGHSSPDGDFHKKRRQQKLNMKLSHLNSHDPAPT